MRISDWSSDVCSSDLNARLTAEAAKARIQDGYGRARAATEDFAAKASEQAGVAREAAGEAYEKGKVQAKRANSKLKEAAERSEEHTSDLKSLMRISYAVFCSKIKIPLRTDTKHDRNSTSTTRRPSIRQRHKDQ